MYALLTFNAQRHLQSVRLIVSSAELPQLMIDADYATDSVIQESLRKELDKGVTLLTIAHRLQTIMDADKIVSHLVYSHK